MNKKGINKKSKKKPIEKDIKKFLNKCIKDNILSEFLQEHKEEVMNIETMLFDQEYVSEMYDRELFEEGKAEGISSTLISLVKKGLLNISEAAKELGMTEKEFKSLMTA